jgi:hypothetical protein
VKAVSMNSVEVKVRIGSKPVDGEWTVSAGVSDN